MRFDREKVAEAMAGLRLSTKVQPTEEQRLAIADEALTKFSDVQGKYERAYQTMKYAKRLLEELAS